MMKRNNLYIATLAFIALMLPACQQDEDIPSHTGYSDEVITFNTPYSARSVLRDGDFEEGDKVGVIGYCKRGSNPSNPNEDLGPVSWDTKQVFAQPDMFYNKKLTYTGNGTFTYQGYFDEDHREISTGICPWYNNQNYLYSFFAYYPYVELDWPNNGTVKNDKHDNMGTIELSSENAAGNPVITYTMPRETQYNNAQPFPVDNVPDLMLAYETDHRQANGAVPLQFRHIFTALQFEVNNYTTEEATITNITLEGRNFYKSIKVTGEQSGYDIGNDRYNGSFDILDGQNELTIPAGTITSGSGDDPTVGEITPSVTPITTADGETLTLMLITDNEDNSVDKGAIVDNNGTCTVTVNVRNKREATMDMKAQKTFTPGTRNIFSINLVGNNLILQLRPTSQWEDDGDSEIVFE